MVASISEKGFDSKLGFSVFDRLFYSNSTLPFANVMPADRVREIFADRDVLFGYGENDFWNTGLTLWSFIGQVLQDGKGSSCNAAVTNATRYMLEHGMEPPSGDSGEYCRARHKLNAKVLRQLVCEIAEKMSLSNPDQWLWQGKNVKLVDGFTFTMPDTLENQKEFPQSKAQEPGIGFLEALAPGGDGVRAALLHELVEAKLEALLPTVGTSGPGGIARGL